MYDAKPRDIAATLTDMQRQALERCRSNQIEAKQKMVEWIKQDRRFDALDAERVASKVQECRASGAIFDVDDPGLRKGGSPRPTALKGYSGGI